VGSGLVRGRLIALDLPVRPRGRDTLGGVAGDGRDDSLAVLIERFTTALRTDGPHRPPTAEERPVVDRLVAAVLAACPSGAGPLLTGLVRAGAATGFTVREIGGRVVLEADSSGPRSWGLVVLPAVGTPLAPEPGAPAVVGTPQVLVEIPHPHSDLRTERVGLGVLERLDGALLLQAGAHRHAGAPTGARRRHDFPADVSHRPDSVFARLAAGIVAARGTPQVQVHGCKDRRGLDVVATSGSAPGSALLDEVTRRLRDAGERVCGAGDPGSEGLVGTFNVQGRLAARLGTPFVHLELSRSLRRDRARLAAVARAVADAVVVTGAGRAGAGPYDRFA
jgi:hypothetical protein